MYGPDPFSTMAYAQMLRRQAEERERVRRRRPQRPRFDDATEPIVAHASATPNTVLGGIVSRFGQSVAMVRGYFRPRVAT